MKDDLLPKIQGKTLFIKDFAPLEGTHPNIFKELRECYDKKKSRRRRIKTFMNHHVLLLIIIILFVASCIALLAYSTV